MKREKAVSRWHNIHKLATLLPGDRLAKAMISLVKRSFKKTPTLVFVPNWSVDGTVGFVVNGIEVTSFSGPLTYRELEACAKILRVMESGKFWIVILKELRPWLVEKAKLLDSYAKIAKEVEESYLEAGKHFKKAQDKLPK